MTRFFPDNSLAWITRSSRVMTKVETCAQSPPAIPDERSDDPGSSLRSHRALKIMLNTPNTQIWTLSSCEELAPR